jgi:hypothetical protein
MLSGLKEEITLLAPVDELSKQLDTSSASSESGLQSTYR